MRKVLEISENQRCLIDGLLSSSDLLSLSFVFPRHAKAQNDCAKRASERSDREFMIAGFTTEFSDAGKRGKS